MTSQPAARATSALLLIIICGCLIAVLNNGPRTSLGFFLPPISEANGWGRAVFSQAMAVQQVSWGVGAFLLGATADKFGSWRVMALSALLYAAGLALMPAAHSGPVLTLTAGIMTGFGLAGCSFGLIMACFGRVVTPQQRPLVFGIATAAASLGQFVFSPLTTMFIAQFGWQNALYILAGMVGLIPVLAIPLRGKATPHSRAELQQTIGDALTEALAHRSYVLLALGFFVCGFQIAFITTHFPAYLLDAGMDPKWGYVALMMIGLFNIVGSLSSGMLGSRMPKRYLLAGIYLARSVLYIAFITLPITPASVIIFSGFLGLLWLSTVSPTNSLVAVMFGTRYFGMLAGIVFLSHQIGGFIGVWLGGYLYDLNHSYAPVWWISIALGVFAGVVHLPIIERPVARLAPAE